MGQVLHGSARTTEVRRAIQHSQASVRTLAERYSINPKTVAKWKKRQFASDAPMGPREPCSTVLSGGRRHVPTTHAPAAGRLSLRPASNPSASDQVIAPPLLPAAWHQPVARGRGRQAEAQGLQDLSDRLLPHRYRRVRTEEGKLYLFVAIDRTSKFAYAELHNRADRQTATAFLEAVIQVVPYKIHTVLTDNGIQLCDLPKHRSGPTARWRTHMFDLLCQQNGIEHRLTKPNHPWTNGQVERMNRTLKEATVNRYHYETAEQLRLISPRP